MPTLTLRANTRIQHPWHRKPVRCHEVDLKPDDGPVLVAARFRSRRRAEQFVAEAFDRYGFEHHPNANPRLVQGGWYAKGDPLRLVLAIDETI